MTDATARECRYVVLDEVTVTADDLQALVSTCREIADHALTLAIEGGGRHTDYLCCHHRTMVLEEMGNGIGLPGVTLVHDRILAPGFAFRVLQPLQNGRWLIAVMVTAGSSGVVHTMPPCVVEGETYEQACDAAQAQVDRLEAIAKGNSDSGTDSGTS